MIKWAWTQVSQCSTLGYVIRPCMQWKRIEGNQLYPSLKQHPHTLPMYLFSSCQQLHAWFASYGQLCSPPFFFFTLVTILAQLHPQLTVLVFSSEDCCVQGIAKVFCASLLNVKLSKRNQSLKKNNNLAPRSHVCCSWEWNERFLPLLHGPEHMAVRGFRGNGYHHCTSRLVFAGSVCLGTVFWGLVSASTGAQIWNAASSLQLLSIICLADSWVQLKATRNSL